MAKRKRMSIKIESGVPLPPKKAGQGRAPMYGWLDMRVGQSFLFPRGVKKNSTYGAAHAASKRYAPKTFVVRQTEEGLRCWRIK